MEAAEQARTQLVDLPTALRFAHRASELSSSPLSVQKTICAWLREAGRIPELLESLAHLAQLALNLKDVPTAREAFQPRSLSPQSWLGT